MTDVVELHLLRHAARRRSRRLGRPRRSIGRSRAKGERQAERLGRFLAGIGFRPDAIISSPKLRASQTAEIVAGQLGVPVTLDERLAGGVDETTSRRSCATPATRGGSVLVGHDPDFSSLLSRCASHRTCEMKKGALARIDVDRPVGAGRGDLRWLVPPDLLKPG